MYWMWRPNLLNSMPINSEFTLPLSCPTTLLFYVLFRFTNNILFFNEFGFVLTLSRCHFFYLIFSVSVTTANQRNFQKDL